MPSRRFPAQGGSYTRYVSDVEMLTEQMCDLYATSFASLGKKYL